MNNATPETRQQRRARSRMERKGPAKLQKNAYQRALVMFRERAEALKAAAVTGPTAKLALMELAHKLGQYKSRGHGRGSPMRRYGQAGNNGGKSRPHMSGQECMRRAVGGWGFRSRITGLTKTETLRLLAPHGRIPLERAVAIVQGLRKVEPMMDLRRAA